MLHAGYKCELAKGVIALASDNIGESLFDLFIFETSQNIEQLEQIILDNEKESSFASDAINEIFRIMHTIKGSAAMMMFDNISSVAHKVEDLFYFIREHSAEKIDYNDVPDLVLESLDFIRCEMEKIKTGITADGDGAAIVTKIAASLKQKKDKYQDQPQIMPEKEANDVNNANDQKLIIDKKPKKRKANREKITEDNKNTYKAHVYFEEDCQMESLRSFDIINKIYQFAEVIEYKPGDIMENDNSASIIRERGFEVTFKTAQNITDIDEFFSKLLFLRKHLLKEIAAFDLHQPAEVVTPEMPIENKTEEKQPVANATTDTHTAPIATMINVNVAKLDKLMDLVGEMVISEAMVVENPDLKGLEIENFKKASRQLHKITSELQDTVMSIRMVPLADVFQKMHRVMRDMCKKLGKDVKLEIIGEDTEADKNIITHLSDPLMHLVRNCIDHGIESEEDRVRNNKPKTGKVTLEARNAGNDVLVIVRDDGMGLDKNKILAKAKENGLLNKDSSEMSDSEVYNLIFIPGFSTNDNITEFSGRGVGMDVVTSNIEEVGGSVSIDSTQGVGTAITIKIPLTLAIIDGMNIQVGDSLYTIPTISIKESFFPKQQDLLTDPDGNEMIMVRGQCYAIVRLHQCLNVKTEVTDFTQGIFIMIEQYEKTVCIFADELIGQQQVVVKTLPKYIKNNYKINGLAGCTLLGNGGISLILDVGWFTGYKK